MLVYESIAGQRQIIDVVEHCRVQNVADIIDLKWDHSVSSFSAENSRTYIKRAFKEQSDLVFELGVRKQVGQSERVEEHIHLGRRELAEVRLTRVHIFENYILESFERHFETNFLFVRFTQPSIEKRPEVLASRCEDDFVACRDKIVS